VVTGRFHDEAPRFGDRIGQCLICGSGRLREDFSMLNPSQDLLHWSQCKGCGFTFMNPKLSFDQMQRAYDSDEYWTQGSYGSDYLGEEASRFDDSRARLKYLARFVPPGGELLDVGCATGSFAAAACQQGYVAIGIDPAQEMIEFGRRLYGLDLRAQTLEGSEFAPERFDVISVLGTDSHFYDPRESFSTLARWLKPGGHLLFSYQDYGHWIRWFFPNIKRAYVVYYNFTRKSLHLFLEQVGLSVLGERTKIQNTSVRRIALTIGIHGRMLGPFNDLRLRLPTISYRLLVARKIRGEDDRRRVPAP